MRGNESCERNESESNPSRGGGNARFLSPSFTLARLTPPRIRLGLAERLQSRPEGDRDSTRSAPDRDVADTICHLLFVAGFPEVIGEVARPIMNIHDRSRLIVVLLQFGSPNI